MNKNAGRPRTSSQCAIPSPLSIFIDTNWDRLGLTNDAAAAKLGLQAPNMISMWRTGRSAVGLARITEIGQLLKVDIMQIFVLWMKQQRLRDDEVPASLVEMVERRLITENEAEVIAAIRNATKHANPKFRPAQVNAFARVAVA